MPHSVKIIDKEKATWRSNSLFFIHRAKYHTSKSTLIFLENINITYIILDPYDYHALQVIQLFADSKKNNLNPQNLGL